MGYAERIQTMKRVFWMGGIELCREQMLLFLMESGLAGPGSDPGQDGNGCWFRRRLYTH